MPNPISVAFKKAKKEGRPALLTYTVAGDSSKKQSLDILNSISKNADILEIGLPHNTPVADGSQIQTSAYRAIKNGIKINDIFKIVKDFKSFNKSKPVILMGYYNMIFQYGENNFLKKCKVSGVNGLIVVDLPWPENKKFANKCKKKSIYFIQLLSPTTTTKRLKKIIKDSHSMNYFISMLSTTGGKLKVSPTEIMNNYDKIKRINPKKNVVIGFGITEKTIKSLKKADGLVVGSAICKEISNSLKKRQNVVTNVNNEPTGKLILIGDAIQGSTLTVSAANISDEDGWDGNIIYTWTRDSITMQDSTGSFVVGESYTLTADDVGKYIAVGGTFTDDGGEEEIVSSDTTNKVTAQQNVGAFSVINTGSGTDIILDFYLDSALDSGSDGFNAIQATVNFSLSEGALQSASMNAELDLGVVNDENKYNGEVIFGGVTVTNFTDFSQPIFTMNMYDMDIDNALTLSVTDVIMDDVPLANSTLIIA